MDEYENKTKNITINNRLKIKHQFNIEKKMFDFRTTYGEKFNF